MNHRCFVLYSCSVVVAGYAIATLAGLTSPPWRASFLILLAVALFSSERERQRQRRDLRRRIHAAE